MFELIFLSSLFIFTASHNIEKRQILTDFNNVVRQKTNGNQISQCPCVIHPESGQCITYDSRYLASNIEEAILTFKDPTNDNYQPNIVNSAAFQCSSSQCQQCFGTLFYRLREIGLVPNGFRPTTRLLAQNQLNSNACPRYTFTRGLSFRPAPRSVPNYVRSLISAGLQNRQRLFSNGMRQVQQFARTQRFMPSQPQIPKVVQNNGQQPFSDVNREVFQGPRPDFSSPRQFAGNREPPFLRPDGRPPWRPGRLGGFRGPLGRGGHLLGGRGPFGGRFGGRRGKRETQNGILGQVYTVSCTERGQATGDMLSLCGACWTWRELPEDYFPRIVNELSCESGDFCLSGWGQCVQQYRNTDVLKKVGGRWVPTVISTGSCCDCRVKAGTEIHSLVVGDKR